MGNLKKTISEYSTKIKEVQLQHRLLTKLDTLLRRQTFRSSLQFNQGRIQGGGRTFAHPDGIRRFENNFSIALKGKIT